MQLVPEAVGLSPLAVVVAAVVAHSARVTLAACPLANHHQLGFDSSYPLVRCFQRTIASDSPSSGF